LISCLIQAFNYMDEEMALGHFPFMKLISTRIRDIEKKPQGCWMNIDTLGQVDANSALLRGKEHILQLPSQSCEDEQMMGTLRSLM
ncbi:hypothetical protein Tco_1535245, partial [Tanacetum coccineum]